WRTLLVVFSCVYCFSIVRRLPRSPLFPYTTLFRSLAIDSTVDIFTFYVPHRHVYGEQWIKFMKDGVNATPLPTVNTTRFSRNAEIGRAVQQECRDRSRMPSSA